MTPDRCTHTKAGRFHRLRCVREAGHRGGCNFVILGVREDARRKLATDTNKGTP